MLAKDEEIGRGDGVEKSDLLGDRVCSGSQSMACSIGRKRQEVHLGVVTLEDKVASDKG